MNQDRIVDFLDLRIVLTEDTEKQFQNWLKEFEETHDFIEIQPRIKNGELQINSTDLIAFLGYIDPAQLNDLQWQRFKQRAAAELDQQLLRAVRLDRQGHYKWCLGALKNLKAGRYRDRITPEQSD
jgi:hypothetical protein